MAGEGVGAPLGAPLGARGSAVGTSGPSAPAAISSAHEYAIGIW